VIQGNYKIIDPLKPLHKKGDTGELQNYRPISLLSVFSKIIEKLMYSRLMSFVTKNGILSDAQHGFRKGKPRHSNPCFP